MDIKDKGCLEEELMESCNVSRQQFKGSKVFQGEVEDKRT